MHFNKYKIKETKIKVNIVAIKSYKTVHFYGIIFDLKLPFIFYIDNVLQKCFRAINIIRFIRGVWWGADPETLIFIYKSFVRS